MRGKLAKDETTCEQNHKGIRSSLDQVSDELRRHQTHLGFTEHGWFGSDCTYIGLVSAR